MDVYQTKNIKPMLIGVMGDAFDSPDFIYELKLDGERCIAYLDETTFLQNRHGIVLTFRFPELKDMNRSVNCKCIIDGEVIVMKDGKPYFPELQRRALMSNKMKVGYAVSKFPACFIAFDILYYGDRDVTKLPLMERKEYLNNAINENERIAISRYIENNGIAFYELTKKQDLEGIVAKKKDSLYFTDKRTKDWIKIKNLLDEDFIVCGYIEKENNVVSIVLGQYSKGNIVYKGHVTLGISSHDFSILLNTPRIEAPGFDVPSGNGSAVWLKPVNVCTVKYMTKTAGDMLRQPVFKGLRDDKSPEECLSEK